MDEQTSGEHPENGQERGLFGSQLRDDGWDLVHGTFGRVRRIREQGSV